MSNHLRFYGLGFVVALAISAGSASASQLGGIAQGAPYDGLPFDQEMTAFMGAGTKTNPSIFLKSQVSEKGWEKVSVVATPTTGVCEVSVHGTAAATTEPTVKMDATKVFDRYFPTVAGYSESYSLVTPTGIVASFTKDDIIAQVANVGEVGLLSLKEGQVEADNEAFYFMMTWNKASNLIETEFSITFNNADLCMQEILATSNQ
jgi:hypothetical protein